MDVASLHGDFGGGRVEVFVFDLAFEAAVHRVGEFRPEPLYVEEIHSAADLFVRREPDPDRAVFRFGVGRQVFGCGHDFGDAGFVVGAEQCRAVGHNQPVPFVERQFREIGGAHREFVVQRDIAAVVAFDNAGADVRPFHIGTGIDVRNEADDRGRLAARRRRDRTGDIAVRIDLDIVQSEGRHLFEQVVQQGQLFGRRRIGFAFRVALRVESDVF